MIDPKELPHKTANKKREFTLVLKNLNKKNARKIDTIVHSLHDEVFENLNCLDCGNCCRGLGPKLSEADVKRISKALRMKTADFEEKYLRIDEDNDTVFKGMPCPFLGTDNYCSIYENRPKACREYPHTNRKNFFQLKQLTLKNCETCPAVFEILEGLSAKL